MPGNGAFKKLKNLYSASAADFESAGAITSASSTSDLGDYLDAATKSGLLGIQNFSKDKNAPVDLGYGVPSTINRYSLFQFKGAGGNTLQAHDYLDTAPGYSDTTRSPGTPGSMRRDYSDTLMKAAKLPDATNIIQYFKDNNKVAMRYSYADFLYCRYYGRIPNNHMITIRRFAMPTVDNLWADSVYDYASKSTIKSSQPDLARAIGFLGETAGNSLEEILGIKFNFKWKDIESEMQVEESNKNGINKGSPILGAGTKGFSPAAAISSVTTLSTGQSSASADNIQANQGYNPLTSTYPNFVEGPLNIIKQMQIQEKGLEFSHEFKINLQYDLRTYGEINPKMAFLDIMANLLVLTYNNAPFWGGANRMLSNGQVGSPVGNRAMLESGDLAGFFGSVMKDISSAASNIFGKKGGGFDIASIGKGLGNIAGDMLGGWLSENLNTPQAANIVLAFLSGAPVGKWHVTIGNPMNPIACIGNLNLQDTNMKLHGPLGLDDFPTLLDVELSFKPARPRDKSEIESMFNAGQGRLYYAPEGFKDVLNIAGLEETQAKGATGYNKNLQDKNGPTENGSNKAKANPTDIMKNSAESESGQAAGNYINNRLSSTIGSDRSALIANTFKHVVTG